ncbi:MAG: biopolymer transporter ExbD [Planctomycetes bacterium]|nr:biopolymer transporter ExbD [Planctomycetota bacterium]
MSDRRIKPKYEESSLDLPMTPMIDVIFQLIIFFMCSIQFKALEGKLLSYLPKDKGGCGGDPPYIEEVRVNLIYNQTKPPLLTDIKIGQNPVRDWDELYNKVSVLWADIRTQAIKEEDIKPFKIDASDKIPAQAVVNTLDVLKRAGVAKIEFAVKPPK